jgi:hypothetical protein
VRTKRKKHFDVSVKAIRAGGKWGVGTEDHGKDPDLVFLFLHYKNFDDPTGRPDAYVVPGAYVEENKQRWFNQFGIYYSHKELKTTLNQYKENWKLFD